MSQTLDFDAVVVGASASGLVVSRTLAEAGWRVAVYERRPALGEPARTWIVTEEIRSALDFDLGQSVVNEIDQLHLASCRESTLVRLRAPDLIVERASILSQLAAWAEAAGARVHFGHDLRGLRISNESAALDILPAGETRVRTIHCRAVVGADGTYSRVAENVGAGPQVVVPIVQACVRLPIGFDPRLVRVWFDRQTTRFFYWLIPESNDHGVLGLVADRAGTARHLLDGFAARLHLRPLKYQGAVIPLHQPLRQIEWRRGLTRVLLVGDAASHVKVTTVGGLVSGVRGAQAAARSLIHGTSYSSELAGLSAELYLHYAMRWALDRFSDADYDWLIAGLNRPLRRLLEHRNRDTMAGAISDLLTLQPTLLWLAGRRALWPYRPRPSPRVTLPISPPAEYDEPGAGSRAQDEH